MMINKTIPKPSQKPFHAGAGVTVCLGSLTSQTVVTVPPSSLIITDVSTDVINAGRGIL